MFAIPTAKDPGVRSRRSPRSSRRRAGRSWLLLLKVAVLTALLGAVMTQVVLGTAGARGPALVVRPGQTLWGIAVARYPQADPRDAIGAIESANHLDGANITPGERLLLPPV